MANKKIIPLGCVTRLDLDPDQILTASMGHLEGVVVVGFDKDGRVCARSSYADGGTVMWLLECCKQQLLTGVGSG